MNYDKLFFTEADTKRLTENRDEIVKWIMDNVVSHLRENEYIKIDFGGTHSSIRTFNTTENYHIMIMGASRKWYGLPEGESHIGFAEKFGSYGDMTKLYDNRDIYALIDNWGYIKSELLNEVENRKQAKANIYAFKV